jgi:hypothetical protein
MTAAEKHIHHYNRLNGKKIGKEELATFHRALSADIQAGRIDAHMPLGVECIDIEKRIGKAVKQMNGHKVQLECKVIDVEKILSLQKKEIKKTVPVKKVPTKETSRREVKPAVLDNTALEGAAKVPAPSSFPTGAFPVRIPKTVSLSGLGFVPADKAPAKAQNTFSLPGEVGRLLGKLQRYKLEIIIDGETHSSKSELAKQIADAFASIGDEVGWLDWEQGGLQSRDTLESIRRNIKESNRKKIHVSADVPKTLEAVKSLAGKFPVIVLDSGSSLKMITNTWVDELREQYPDTVWIILFQQNVKGGTRGGTSAEYDAPVVLKTYRPDESDFKKNYAYVFKNRGNDTGKYYLIASKKIVKEEPGKVEKTLPVKPIKLQGK